MTAGDDGLVPFNDTDYQNLVSLLQWSKVSTETKDKALKFLYRFHSNDIICANFQPRNIYKWNDNETIFDYIIDHSQINGTIRLQLICEITQNQANGITNTFSNTYFINIQSKKDLKHVLKNVQQGNNSYKEKEQLEINNLIPRFIHVTTIGKTQDINIFKQSLSSDFYINLNSIFNISHGKKPTPKFSPSCSYSDSDYVTMFFFNDQIPLDKIRFLDRYGIIGLYTTFILVLARFLRTIFQTSQKIIFNEVANIEPVWKLLQDLDFIRDDGQFQMEEDLFALVLFLYRSPETLLRFTKLKFD